MSFREVVDAFTSLVLSHDVAVPVAAMHALVLSIERSDATTWMELEDELRSAIASLKRCRHEDLGGRTSLSLGSGCELFMLHVTRAFNLQTDIVDFSHCKRELLIRGEKFAGMSLTSRSRIAETGSAFVGDGSTVLVHGNSRVVHALILKAAETKQFNVLVTEGRPGNGGSVLAKSFVSRGIPTKLILDCAVGTFMDQVDMVLVGAEGVMENGGIVNKTGTYQISMVARALNKPVYVAVESYKFARMYPLTQRDIYDLCATNDDGDEGEEGERNECNGNGNGSDSANDKANQAGAASASAEYTPPKSRFSSSLLSDMGGVLGSPDAGMPHPVLLQRSTSGNSDTFTVSKNNSSMLEYFDITGANGSDGGSNRDSGKFNLDDNNTGSSSSSGNNNNKRTPAADLMGGEGDTSGSSPADGDGNNKASSSSDGDSGAAAGGACVPCSHMLIDFTPAEFITLLFTDLGVLTPAAVSDELIRLYQ